MGYGYLLLVVIVKNLKKKKKISYIYFPAFQKVNEIRLIKMRIF